MDTAGDVQGGELGAEIVFGEEGMGAGRARAIEGHGQGPHFQRIEAEDPGEEGVEPIDDRDLNPPGVRRDGPRWQGRQEVAVLIYIVSFEDIGGAVHVEDAVGVDGLPQGGQEIRLAPALASDLPQASGAGEGGGVGGVLGPPPLDEGIAAVDGQRHQRQKPREGQPEQHQGLPAPPARRDPPPHVHPRPSPPPP